MVNMADMDNMADIDNMDTIGRKVKNLMKNKK